MCPVNIAQLVGRYIIICRGRSSNSRHPTYSLYKVNSSHYATDQKKYRSLCTKMLDFFFLSQNLFRSLTFSFFFPSRFPSLPWVSFPAPTPPWDVSVLPPIRNAVVFLSSHGSPLLHLKNANFFNLPSVRTVPVCYLLRCPS